MNQTFKVFLASMLAAALCGFAQEFGGQEGGTETAPVAEVVDGGGAQILRQAQEAEEGEQNAAPVMFLENYLAEKGWNKGYDEEKNRIIVVGKVDFDVDDPEHITKDFIHLRSVKMNELLLRLKGQVIQLIFSTMSAQRILDIPGNPIQVVINEELKQAEESLASAAKALEKLNE